MLVEILCSRTNDVSCATKENFGGWVGGLDGGTKITFDEMNVDTLVCLAGTCGHERSIHYK